MEVVTLSITLDNNNVTKMDLTSTMLDVDTLTLLNIYQVNLQLLSSPTRRKRMGTLAQMIRSSFLN